VDTKNLPIILGLPLVSAISLSAFIAISSTDLSAKQLQQPSKSQLLHDSDNDGLSDDEEITLGTERYLSDTDGDGISDGEEVGSNPSTPRDSDNDGRIDALDSDDDNDGLPTIFETQDDMDNDGTPNYLDTDSDNDGITDGVEAGMTERDIDSDGIDNLLDVDSTGGQDTNGDGIDDNFQLPDSNNDGKPDYLDKRIKNISSRPLLTDELSTLHQLADNSLTKEPTEKLTHVDVDPSLDQDHDGIPDIIEIKIGTNPKQRDSDNDHISDAIEIGLIMEYPQDSDHDGIIDAMDEDDDDDGILTRLEDPNRDGSPINDDTDDDGVPNYLDANDDGDSVLTKNEGGTLDTDNDGVLDYLDKVDGVDRSVAAVKENRRPLNTEVPIQAPTEPNLTSPHKQVANNQLAKHLSAAEQSLRKVKTDFDVKTTISTAFLNNKEENKSLSSKAMAWLTSLLPD